MTRSLLAIAILLTCAVSAARADERALNLPIGDPARSGREVALTLDGITDAARGDVITPPELAARLDGVKLVFVGESHTDTEFHRVQLRVIQELHRRGRQVLVGLEMYPATAEQQWLDRWSADKTLTEEAFLSESHWYKNWGYHWNYYRDIFVFARENGIRMFGVNVPRDVVQTARTKGLDGAHARAAGAPARARRHRERRAPAAVPRLLRRGGRAPRQHARRDVPGDVPRPVHLGRGDGLATRSRPCRSTAARRRSWWC